LEEFGRLRARVADEDVQFSEFLRHLAKDLGNLCRVLHISPNQDTIRPALSHLRERLFRGSLILVVVNRDINVVFCQRQRDSSPDPT
jgi:hypothetical protein